MISRESLKIMIFFKNDYRRLYYPLTVQKKLKNIRFYWLRKPVYLTNFIALSVVTNTPRHDSNHNFSSGD